MLKIVLVFVALMTMSAYGNNSMEGTFDSCSLQCSNGIGGDVPVSTNHHSPRHLIRGKSGPPGPKGDRGNRGAKGQDGKNCDITQVKELESRISELESDVIRQKNASQEDIARLERNVASVTGKLDASQDEVVRLKEHVTTLKGQMNASQEDMERNLGFVIRKLWPQNCSQIKEQYPGARSGSYTVFENIFAIGKPVLCDMTDEGELFISHNCKELYDIGCTEDRVHTITVNNSPLQVFCQDDGWTVIQKRSDDSLDYSRNFDQYAEGFGSVEGEHWLGLNHVHDLTSTGSWTIRFDLTAFDGDTAWVEYDNFRVDPGTNFTLWFDKSSIRGTAGNAFDYHHGMKFSTIDMDQDLTENLDCAELIGSSGGGGGGGWWYRSCINSITTGMPYREGWSIKWHNWKKFAALKAATVKIRLN